MNSDLVKAASEYKSWLVDDALPLWGSVGINSQSGASFERLLKNGKPDLECNVRLRVQARQIFVFCFAQEQAWIENGESVVEGMSSFVDKYGRHSSGSGYIHLLDANKKTIDVKQDLYDHAFHMLANIWHFRVFKSEQALKNAESIFSLFESRLASSSGGWLEGDYPADCRRQNPHMHLFEAFIAGFEATGDSEWLERANRMYELFERHFFSEKNGALLEFFDEDWVPLDGAAGRIIEPGHMMEWVWLLRNFARHSGVNVDSYANALYQTALSSGQDESGLLFDELDLSGKVLSATKRCWPMTELIKASIVQAQAGHKECEAIAAKAIVDLRAFYLQAQVAGAYIDRLDEQNQVVADFAPASTLYHLVVAAAEACSYAEIK